MGETHRFQQRSIDRQDTARCDHQREADLTFESERIALDFIDFAHCPPPSFVYLAEVLLHLSPIPLWWG